MSAVPPWASARPGYPFVERTATQPDVDLADALSAQGWAVLHDCLDPALVAALRGEVFAQGDLSGMYRAGVGRGVSHRVLAAVRGDWIRWLDGSTDAQRALFERLEAIRAEANRSLLLGLFEFEAHFALYPPGSGYERHVDSFQQDNPRRLSVVLYLNPDWGPADGGELVLYDAQGVEAARVLPEAGTLAVFLSQTVPHAVLPPRRWRASVAAWFRVRGALPPILPAAPSS